MIAIAEVAQKHELPTASVTRAALELYDLLQAYNPDEVAAVADLIKEGYTKDMVKDYCSDDEAIL